MNVNQFEYNKSPFTKVRKHDIMTLSEKGINKYFNKDSYTARYLARLSPQREKDIFKKCEQEEITEEKEKLPIINGKA
jgi:hypothetical protein